MNAIIAKKQAISLIEREMERFLEQREKISRKLNRLMKKLEKAVAIENHQHQLQMQQQQQQQQLQLQQQSQEMSKDTSMSLTGSNMTTNTLSTNSTNSDINTKSSSGFESISKVDELREQIDIMKSNIDYLQDQIAECQTNIIQLDEAKDGCDYFNLESLIHTISSIDEAKFLLKKFLIFGLNKGILAAQKEHLNNELDCELDQLEKDYYIQQQVITQIVNSGQISNDFLQQLVLYNQPLDQIKFNNSNPNNNNQTSFNNNINNTSFMNGVNDNFEIDEIILAPMIDGICPFFVLFIQLELDEFLIELNFLKKSNSVLFFLKFFKFNSFKNYPKFKY